MKILLTFCLLSFSSFIFAQNYKLLNTVITKSDYKKLTKESQQFFDNKTKVICDCMAKNEAIISDFHASIVEFTDLKDKDEAAFQEKAKNELASTMEQAKPFLMCVGAAKDDDELRDKADENFKKMHPDLNQTDLNFVKTTYGVYGVEKNCGKENAKIFRMINAFMAGLAGSR